jgi:hypothetical protein
LCSAVATGCSVEAISWHTELGLSGQGAIFTSLSFVLVCWNGEGVSNRFRSSKSAGNERASNLFQLYVGAVQNFKADDGKRQILVMFFP